MLNYINGWVRTEALFRPDSDAKLEAMGLEKEDKIEEREPSRLAFRIYDLLTYTEGSNNTTIVALHHGDYTINVSYDEFEEFMDYVLYNEEEEHYDKQGKGTETIKGD